MASIGSGRRGREGSEMLAQQVDHDLAIRWVVRAVPLQARYRQESVGEVWGGKPAGELG